MEDQDLGARCAEILSACLYANIATAQDNQPWNTPVTAVPDTNLNLYWSSWTEAVHSKNILAFTLGRLMEIGAALVRSDDDPPLTRSMIRMIGRQMTSSDAAARRDLGDVGKASRADGLAAYRV